MERRDADWIRNLYNSFKAEASFETFKPMSVGTSQVSFNVMSTREPPRWGTMLLLRRSIVEVGKHGLTLLLVSLMGLGLLPRARGFNRTPGTEPSSREKSSPTTPLTEKKVQHAVRAMQAGQHREALKILRSVEKTDHLPASYFLLRGTIAARLNELESAERDLLRAVTLDSTIAQAFYTLGLVQLRRRKPREAIASLYKASNLNSQRPEIWLALGQAYSSTEEVILGKKAFEKALRLGKDVAPIRYGLGKAFEGLKDYANAIVHYEQAIFLDGSNSSARIAMVRCLLRAGQHEEAIRRVEQWDDRNIGSAFLHAELGILFGKTKLFDAAIRAFQKGLEKQPDSYDLNYDLARAYYSAGRYVESAQTTKKLLQRHETAEIHHLLGLVYEQTSQPSMSRMEFQEAIRLAPHEGGSYLHLGSLFLQSKEYDKAQGIFAEGRQNCSGESCLKTLVGLGIVYKLQGKRQLATAVFQEAVQRFPDNFIAHIYHADLLISQGQFEEASRSAKKAIQLSPESSLAHYMCAYSLMKSPGRDLSEAAGFLKEAIRLDPKNALAYYRLGLISNLRKNYPEALRNLEHAVELDPSSNTARYQLGLAYQRSGNKELADRQFLILRQSRKEKFEEEERNLIRGFGDLLLH